MEQSDYTEQQIEMMAKTLAALIKRLMGINIKEAGREIEKITYTTLKDELDITIDELMLVQAEEVCDYLTTEKNIHREWIESLADIMVINAKAAKDQVRRETLLQYSLEMLFWLDQSASAFSFERHEKRGEILEMLGMD